MQQVNIYIDFSSRTPRAYKRQYGYVLECTIRGEIYTKESFGECNGTLHKCMLSVIMLALGRLREDCIIKIHGPDAYILNMIKTQLPIWAVNGFVDSKGHGLADAAEWRIIWGLLGQQEYDVSIGRHAYSDWMRAEFTKAS